MSLRNEPAMLFECWLENQSSVLTLSRLPPALPPGFLLPHTNLFRLLPSLLPPPAPRRGRLE